MAEACPPKFTTPEPQNMTLVENRVYADVISWIGVGPQSNDWYPRKKRRGHVRTEIRELHLKSRNSKDRQGLPEAGRGRK